MVFVPLQTALGEQLCREHGMPLDVSTVVLIDELGAHKKSTAILRALPHLGAPFYAIYLLLTCIPCRLRDAGYDLFARNRGSIWKTVKRITGMGDTMLWGCRDRILGLEGAEEPLLARFAVLDDARGKVSKWLGFKVRLAAWVALALLVLALACLLGLVLRPGGGKSS
mmetsp:Transcript_142630/g.443619  ORF Transcript_142630/g.443619 Transcript_142630/m.443619 type:complete len:168 (-) Transcript_142630:242-745(-)